MSGRSTSEDEKGRRIYHPKIPGYLLDKLDEETHVDDDDDIDHLISFNKYNRRKKQLTIFDKIGYDEIHQDVVGLTDEEIIEGIENEMLYEKSSSKTTSLYPEKIDSIDEDSVAETTTDLKFYKPSEIDSSSDDDSGNESSDNNSSKSSDDSSDTNSSDESSIDSDNTATVPKTGKRGEWMTKARIPTDKKQKIDDNDRKKNMENLIDKMELNISMMVIQDMEQTIQIGNIETVSRLEEYIKTTKNEARKNIDEIKDNDKKKRKEREIKILTPHKIDSTRHNFIKMLSTELGKKSLLDDVLERSIKAYNDMLLCKTRIKRFKFNLEKKFSYDISKSASIVKVKTVIEQLPKFQTLTRKIISYLNLSTTKMMLIDKNSDADKLSLLNVKITYDHGVEMLIENDKFGPAFELSASEYNVLTVNDKVDQIFLQLIKESNVIVFDIANMTHSMKLTMSQINELSEVFNDYGLTTIAVVDNDELILTNATINVVEDKFGHDDITILLYALAYKAIIITNDTHKEFKQIFHVCTTHNTMLTRLNEECNVTDTSSCVIRQISPNKPKYMSIKTYKGGKDEVTVVFDSPIVRHRSMVKKGTTSIRLTKKKSNVVRRWNIPTTSSTPILVNTIRSSLPTASCNVLTFNYKNSTELVVNNNKLKSMAFLLNTMSTETVAIIMRKVTTSLTIINGKITLKDISNRQVQMEDQIVVDRIRTNIETSLIMKMFGTTSLTYKSQSSIRTLFDIPRSTKYANEISVIITNWSLSRGMAALVCDSQYSIIMIDESVISKIETQSLDMIRSGEHDDIKDILPITNKGMSQYITYNNTVWGEKLINDMVKINIGSSVFKPLDLKGFKSGDIYWDLRYDKNTDDITGYVSVEDTKNSIDELDNTIVVKKPKIAVEYYNSSRSGSIYDKLKNSGTNRELLIKYSSSSNVPAITFIRVGRADADKLYNSIMVPIRDKVRLMLEDITCTYKTMVTDNCLVCLPPVIWTFSTDGINIADGLKSKLIHIDYVFKTVNVDIYVSIQPKNTVVAFKLKTDYKVLFPAIAMRYSNNYEYKEFDYFYMDYFHENGIGMLRDDEQIYTCLDNYINYFNIFALPLIYAGFAPSSKLTAFKPVIVDNVVVDYIENKTSPMSEFLDEVILEPAVWLGTTDIGFVYPMKRMIKDGTDVIDINNELHAIIDELMSEDMDQELRYPMFLKIFGLIYPWPIMIQHLKGCYSLPVDEYMDEHEVATIMKQNHRFPCVCKIDEQTQVDTLGNITNYPQQDDRQITTQSAKLLIQHTNKSVQITRMYKFQNSVLLNSVPMIGNVVILDVVKYQAQWKNNRMTFVKRILANQPSMTIMVEKCVIKKTGGTIWNQLGGHLSKLINRGQSIIVILGFDELGPLIKNQKESLHLSITGRTRLYLPDPLLYSSFKNYIKLVNESPDKQRQGTKSTQLVANFNPTNLQNRPILTSKSSSSLWATAFSKEITEDGIIKILVLVIIIIGIMYFLPWVLLWPMYMFDSLGLIGPIWTSISMICTLGFVGCCVWIGKIIKQYAS
jgi:hypothetical protein